MNNIFHTMNVVFVAVVVCFREETEIIEGEVVEIQIDRPASGTVSSGQTTLCPTTFVAYSYCITWFAAREVYSEAGQLLNENLQFVHFSVLRDINF